MRLWSLDPAYLDAKGIVAVWREGLLARAVLRGKTRGYRHHPQLQRFLTHPAPVSAINNYLAAIADEADARGYRFDRSRVGAVRDASLIPVSTGQLAFEHSHLRSKIGNRAPLELGRLPTVANLAPHPLFVARLGPVESWERGVG